MFSIYRISLNTARDKLQQYPHQMIPTLPQVSSGQLKQNNHKYLKTIWS